MRMHFSCHCRVITAPPQLHVRCQQEASPDQNNWNPAPDSCGLDKGNQMFSVPWTPENRTCHRWPVSDVVLPPSTAHRSATLPARSLHRHCLIQFEEKRIPFPFTDFYCKLGNSDIKCHRENFTRL